MLLDNFADIYRSSGSETTPEGKTRPIDPVLLKTGLPCNKQQDDGDLSYFKFGVAASEDRHILFVDVGSDIEVEDIVVVSGTKYEVRKIHGDYTTHKEVLMREHIK